MRILYIVAALLLTTAAGHTDQRSSAIEKLRSLPAADEKKWGQLATLHAEDGQQPKIVTIVLTARGAYLNAGDYSKPPIPFDQLVVELAALPKEAWPCGRLVAYYPFVPGVHLSSVHDPSQEDVKKVDADLKAAGIESVPVISV